MSWRTQLPIRHTCTRKCRSCGQLQMMDWTVIKKEGPVTPSPEAQEEEEE